MSTVFCNLCKPPRRMPQEDIWTHLHEVHDVEPDIATWPDGEPVVVDETLEPVDFEDVRDA